MRGIIWLLGLGGLFCGWWFGAAYLLRIAPAHLSERGVQVQQVKVSGFPASFDVRLDAPVLPARGWRADWAALSLPSYWPFSATGTVSGQQSFAAQGARWQLTGEDMPLRLTVSRGLEVTGAALSGRDMVLTGPINLVLDNLSMTLVPEDTAQSYQLRVDLTGLEIPAVRQNLESMGLRATLRYAAPLRLTSQSTLTELDITDARFASGQSVGTTTGRLNRRPNGLWDGDLTLTLTNWQPILAGLQQSGLLPPDQAPLVMMMAQGMSAGDTLTLPLSVTGSIVSLGPMPLLDLGHF
jgi:hypothetical protein